MIYQFPLATVAWITGLLVLLVHAIALATPVQCRAWLVTFPRSRPAGVALTIIAAIWAFWMVATIDLGEFTHLRKPLMFFIPVGTYLTIRYVEEFLAVRASGMLLLLAAEPLLESSFLQPETGRLLLVVLAYAWAIKGILWVSMPYMMRDQIQWILARPKLWTPAALAGVIYGLAIVVFAISL